MQVKSYLCSSAGLRQLRAGSAGEPMSRSVSKQTGPNGAVWADDVQYDAK